MIKSLIDLVRHSVLEWRRAIAGVGGGSIIVMTFATAGLSLAGVIGQGGLDGLRARTTEAVAGRTDDRFPILAKASSLFDYGLTGEQWSNLHRCDASADVDYCKTMSSDEEIDKQLRALAELQSSGAMIMPYNQKPAVQLGFAETYAELTGCADAQCRQATETAHIVTRTDPLWRWIVKRTGGRPPDIVINLEAMPWFDPAAYDRFIEARLPAADRGRLTLVEGAWPPAEPRHVVFPLSSPHRLKTMKTFFVRGLPMSEQPAIVLPLDVATALRLEREVTNRRITIERPLADDDPIQETTLAVDDAVAREIAECLRAVARRDFDEPDRWRITLSAALPRARWRGCGVGFGEADADPKAIDEPARQIDTIEMEAAETDADALRSCLGGSARLSALKRPNQWRLRLRYPMPESAWRACGAALPNGDSRLLIQSQSGKALTMTMSPAGFLRFTLTCTAHNQDALAVFLKTKTPCAIGELVQLDADAVFGGVAIYAPGGDGLRLIQAAVENLAGYQAAARTDGDADSEWTPAINVASTWPVDAARLQTLIKLTDQFERSASIVWGAVMAGIASLLAVNFFTNKLLTTVALVVEGRSMLWINAKNMLIFLMSWIVGVLIALVLEIPLRALANYLIADALAAEPALARTGLTHFELIVPIAGADRMWIFGLALICSLGSILSVSLILGAHRWAEAGHMLQKGGEQQ